MVSDKEFWTWLKNGRCALYVFEIDEKTGKKIYRPGGRQDARSYYNQLSNTPEINEGP